MKLLKTFSRRLKTSRRLVIENIMDLDHVCVVHRRWFRKLRIVEWDHSRVDYRLESRFFGIVQEVAVSGAIIDDNHYWYEFNGRIASIRVDGAMTGPDGALLLEERITYVFHWLLTPAFWLLAPLFQRQKEDILRDDTALLERAFEVDRGGFRRSVDTGRPKVVVYGGSGFFGRLLVADLLESTNANIVVASRNPQFHDFSPHENRVKFYLSDMNDSDSVRRILDGASVAVSAAGPFQKMPLSLLKACIASKVHYVDVADDRDFVRRAHALAPEVESAGITAMVGCSVVPGMSSLLTQYCVADLGAADEVRICITPGTRLTRGPGSFACLLSTVGKEFSIPWDAGERRVAGWSERESVEFPPPIGSRHVYSVVEIADYFTQPRYFGTSRVRFKIGAELDVLNRALSLYRVLNRAINVDNPGRMIPLFRLFIAMAGRFGTSQGSMMVTVDGGGKTVSMAVARGEGGEIIPALLPSIAVKRSLSGTLNARGIVPLHTWISRETFTGEMRTRGVSLFVRDGEQPWTEMLQPAQPLN